MRRILTLAMLALIVVACSAATVRPPIVWTVAGTMDDGDDCLIANDVTPWPTTAARTLIVQARKVGTTTPTEIKRMVATTGPMSPELTVASFGMWELRGMVADSTGAGCWSAWLPRIAMTHPSPVQGQ